MSPSPANKGPLLLGIALPLLLVATGVGYVAFAGNTAFGVGLCVHLVWLIPSRWEVFRTKSSRATSPHCGTEEPICPPTNTHDPSGGGNNRRCDDRHID